MNAKVKWTGLTNGTIDRVLHLLEGFQSQLGSERPDPREDTEDAQLWDEISDVTFIILREREQSAGEVVAYVCGAGLSRGLSWAENIDLSDIPVNTKLYTHPAHAGDSRR